MTSRRPITSSGHVTRTRLTRIMNRPNFAPDLHEAILFPPRTNNVRDPITESALWPIATAPDWRQQRPSGVDQPLFVAEAGEARVIRFHGSTSPIPATSDSAVPPNSHNR